MRALLVLAARAILAQASPDDTTDWKSLGMSAASSGNLEGAAKYLGNACEIAPKDEDTCYFFARALYTLTRYSEARPAFEIARRSARKKKRERVERAVALNFAALDQPEEAERHFREAVRAQLASDRSGEDSRIDYGAFLTRQGRTSEAAALLERAVRDEPNSPRANAELGRALLHLGRTEQAVRRLEMSVQLDPKVPATRLSLGKAYLELGRAVDGERELRLAQEDWSRHYYGSSTVK